jgi:hypothetical protein
MFNYATIYKYHDSLNNFSFRKQIKKDNVQGSCGILQLKNIPENLEEEKDELFCRDIIVNNKTNNVFYKYGNNGYNCTLERQEHVISVDLLNNCSHLPNFMRPYLYLKNYFINSNSPNPFYIKGIDKKKLSCVDIATFEYINYKCTMYEFLQNAKNSLKSKLSLITQVCLSIICAQQNCEFVHNDLHGSNIVIVKCPQEVILLYKLKILGKLREFILPTYGWIPVIIDFGFSYSKECEGMSVECIDTDDIGYISYKFDCLSDFIRFFVVFNSSIDYKELNDYINNLFDSLPIDKKTSREKIVKKNSMEYIEDKIIENYNNYFGLKNKGTNYLYQLSRFFVRAITLPIKPQPESKKFDIDKNIQKFLKEWNEIEKWCEYRYEKIYLQREFFDTIRKLNKKEELCEKVHNILKEIIGKDVPLDVNWEKLYDSVIKCLICFENMLYKSIMKIDEKRKSKLYSKLISGEYMVDGLLKVIYKDQHILKPDDFILLIDNEDRSNIIYPIDFKCELSTQEIIKIIKEKQLEAENSKQKIKTEDEEKNSQSEIISQEEIKLNKKHEDFISPIKIII